MAPELDRRTYALLALALLVGLAGCGMVGDSGTGGAGETETGDDGDDGDTACGPGETEIAAAADADGQVSITGEVTVTGEASFVVDDGTATAFIQRPGEVSEGDCVTVVGYSVDTGGTEGADVAIQASNITVN